MVVSTLACVGSRAPIRNAVVIVPFFPRRARGEGRALR